MRSMCTFPEMLRRLLERDGHQTQRELARELDVSEAQMSRYLSGKRQPRLSLYLRVQILCESPQEEFSGRQ